MSKSIKVWLGKLDSDPVHLLAYVQSIYRVGRPETYHGTLIQFFIAHHVAPAIDLVRRDVRLRSSDPSNPRDMRLQLISSMAKDKSTRCDTRILHVEPCLLLALDASCLLPAKRRDVASTKAITALSSLVMFDLQSNVEFRVRALANKIAVAESPEVSQWARKTLASKARASSVADGVAAAAPVAVVDDLVSIAGFSGPSLLRCCAAHYSTPSFKHLGARKR